MKNNLKIAIIIPTYSDFIDDTVKAVRSVLKSDYQNKKIIVVDDGSEKEIQSRLFNIFERSFPDVYLKLSLKNEGFAATCNKGAEIAIKDNADILFFLNNDAVIKEDCIGYMVEGFFKENVAIVGPKIYLGKTNILNSVGGYFNKKTLQKIEYGCKVEDKCQFDERREVEFVMGSAFMVSVPVFRQLEGFDDRFYMYTEEADFCYRALKAGYKIIYQPKGIVWHEHAKTIGKRNNQAFYYQIRNGIYLCKKNGQFWHVFNAIVSFHLSHIKRIIKTFFKSLVVFFMAIMDGLRSKMGKRKSRFLD